MDQHEYLAGSGPTVGGHLDQPAPPFRRDGSGSHIDVEGSLHSAFDHPSQVGLVDLDLDVKPIVKRKRANEVKPSTAHLAADDQVDNDPPLPFHPGEEIKLDKHGNPKKKRKQLVACDSCRLRRVKCDRSEKAGGPCSECEKKKITCTDTYVKNKPKTVRSGKLIQQAKALYGDDPTKPLLSPTTGDSNAYDHPPPPAPHSQSRSPPMLLSEQQQQQQQQFQQQQYVSQHSTDSCLVQTRISRDISSELVRTFFTYLHSVCPLVDQDQFESNWHLAGQIEQHLSPANECLAAVLQAWAARISDSPLIVGYGTPSLAELAKSGLERRDLTVVGNRREEFAQAMKDRALRLVDDRGLLRTSSAAACSALTMLEFLVTFDDTSRAKTCGRYLMVAACEHLKNLNEGQCDDVTEPIVPPERVGNGTLLWMVYTRDALVALIGGRGSCFSEDDLTALCDLFTNPITADVVPYISTTDARTLSGLAVASMFRHVVASVRTSISLLTCPLARRQPLSEPALVQIWNELDTSSRYVAIFRQSVEHTNFGANPAPKTHVWFRDLIGIKGQHVLGIHFMLCKRLDEEEARVQKEGVSADANSARGGSESYLDMLRRLKDESDVRFLQVAREWTSMIYLYRSDVIFSAFFTVEYTRDYLHHMVESRAWEQGGPRNYTWANKVDECRALMEIMQAIGWVWAGIDRHITQAQHSLARQNQRLQEEERYAEHERQQRSRQHSFAQYQVAAAATTPSDLYHSTGATSAWPGSSNHSNAVSVSLPPQPFSSTVATSIAPPPPTSYYDSELFAESTYHPPPPLTSVPSGSSVNTSSDSHPGQEHGDYVPISTSNPAFYHYPPHASPAVTSAQSNGTVFELNGSHEPDFVSGQNSATISATAGSEREEIQRLPSMGYRSNGI